MTQYEPCPEKKELNVFVRSIDKCQPVQSVHADKCPNFLLFKNFLACQMTILPLDYNRLTLYKTTKF